MARYTKTTAHEPISRQEEFKTSGALRGEETPGGLNLGPLGDWHGFGRLPQDYREQARGATYAVYSYDTPIAWVKDGVWYIPEVKYSITTTHHQSQARWGAQQSGLPVEHLGESADRKMARVPSSTGGGWGG